MVLLDDNTNLAMKIMTKFVDFPTNNKHFANRWTRALLILHDLFKKWVVNRVGTTAIFVEAL